MTEMGQRSLIDRIGDVTAPVCAECGKPIGDSVSDDFCGAWCQQQWTEHHNGVQELLEYREAADACGDAMVVADGEAGGERLNSAVAEFAAIFDRMQAEWAETDARLSIHRSRSKRRFWTTIGTVLVLLAVYQAAIWLVLPSFPSWATWTAGGVYLAAVVAVNVVSTLDSRRDNRDLKAGREIGSSTIWRWRERGRGNEGSE